MGGSGPVDDNDGNLLVNSILEHHGIKGMKWGVRKDRTPGSADHERSVEKKAKIKAEGVRSLSNAELQDLITRMNLEKQYSNLKTPSAGAKAGKFVSDLLLDIGKKQVNKVAADIATKQIKSMLSSSA